MSHFTVLCIGDNIEEQLNPYYETSDYDDESNRPFLEFEDDSQYRKEYEKNRVITIAEYNGKTIQEAYPVYEDFLKDWHCLEIDKHTGKYGRWYNPNAKWDWYEIGGRWSAFFKLKKGVKHPWLLKEPEEGSFVDQALLKDIDFEGMRDRKGGEAKERYERLERLLGSIPKIQYTWEYILNNSPYKELSLEEKRLTYHTQPAKRYLQHIQETTDLSSEDSSFLCFVNLEDYQVSKEQYIKEARDGAISTFSVLKEGTWYQRGDMGWWACVSNEKDKSVLEEEFSKLIESLSPDTLLTVVDCHI